jgi:hypothetical protein
MALERKFLISINTMKKINITKEIQECDEWINDTSNYRFLFQNPMNCIQEYFNATIDYSNSFRLAMKIEKLSFWYVMNSLSFVLNDRISHQKYWNLFVNYAKYAMRIQVCSIEHPNGNGLIVAYQLHAHFILLLGCGLYLDAEWLGLRIYNSIKQHLKNPVVPYLQEIDEKGLDRIVEKNKEKQMNQRGEIDAFSESPLCGFVLRLWMIMTSRRAPQEALPPPIPQCGVYAALFDHWNDLEKIPDAISDACDFHWLRTREDRKIHHDIAEFSLPPYRQIPFEILAYRNVRKRMGLETLLPSHPLLDSPFVKNLPDELPPSDDPLLQEVLAAVRKVLPDV